MVDGRMMHPGAPYGPVTAGVLPTMPPPPPPMPGMHPMAMPQMPPPGMGGPRLPAHPRTGPGNGAQPQVPSKQLRAAAQPFVPASFRAPAPPKSAAATTATHPGSPRGILEMPSQTSDVASQGNDEQPTSVHTGSDSGSAAGSTHANGTASHDAQQPSPTTEEPVDGSEGQSNGGFEPQQQEMMRALVNNYKQQQERDTGVVDVTKLRLTRGLTNAPGLYNCFLNVIIQSLWHLPTVRHSFLKLTPPTLKGDVTSGSNANVLRSLWNVFRALEASGDPLEGTSGAAHEGLPLPPVSPRELREALSSTATEAASRFELSDMHDAAEVFGELISRLHAAEAGPGAADPTLPSRVARTGDVLHKPAPRSSAASPSAGSSPPGPGSVWGNSAALKRVRKAPTPVNVKGRTTVVRLFGIEVQVPNSTGGSAPGSRCVVNTNTPSTPLS